MSASVFDIAACIAALGGEANTFRLSALAECDSTNTQLMRLADAGAESGTVTVADTQTAGRGRRQRLWFSSPSDSLTFSLLWRFPSESPAPVALSLAVGLGLRRGFASSGVETSVKWPNDILCKGKKLAGVLIEVQPGDIKSAIIGIGVNLRLPSDMPDEVSRNAVGLDEMLLQPPPREHLLGTLLAELAAILRRYAVEGFSGLRNEWQVCHAFQGADVRVSGDGEDVCGLCDGVTEHGELLLRTVAGTRRVISGDVSLRAE